MQTNGVVLPPLRPNLSFRAEREIFYYKELTHLRFLVYRFGMTPQRSFRGHRFLKYFKSRGSSRPHMIVTLKDTQYNKT